MKSLLLFIAVLAFVAISIMSTVATALQQAAAVIGR